MAIFIDAPTDWGHRFGPSSHLICDIAGAEGTFELTAFAHQIGMAPAWLQNRGTEKEHFDLFGPRIDWALSHGAELVHRRKIVTIIREKRSFYASLGGRHSHIVR